MDKIKEMIEARQAPGASVFRERWVENLGQHPVYVTSERQHKELQKANGCTFIGDDGVDGIPSLKEAKEKVMDRNADKRRRND